MEGEGPAASRYPAPRSRLAPAPPPLARPYPEGIILRHHFAILALLLGAGFGTVPAPAHARPTVPIQGAITGSVAVIPLSGDNTYRLENTGAGTMSHLGRVETTWAIPGVELDLINRVLIVANPEWTGVITTANGDVIRGRYTFPAATIPFTVQGDVIFTTELEITGGTGRFGHATGRATASGHANIFTRGFHITLEGEMTPAGPAE